MSRAGSIHSPLGPPPGMGLIPGSILSCAGADGSGFELNRPRGEVRVGGRGSREHICLMKITLLFTLPV